MEFAVTVMVIGEPAHTKYTRSVEVVLTKDIMKVTIQKKVK